LTTRLVSCVFFCASCVQKFTDYNLKKL